jgi:hypothetical protein
MASTGKTQRSQNKNRRQEWLDGGQISQIVPARSRPDGKEITSGYPW